MGDIETEPADVPPLRVIFDENMSSRVAKALNLVEKDVTRTPAAKRGKKATPDNKVARGAKRAGRFVFTNNFDMVVAAVEEDARVIWFYDKHHNSPTLFNQARMFFDKWAYWERLLAPEDAYCIRVSMSRTTLITKEAARKQASRLDRKSKAKRAKIKANAAQGKLDFND